MVVAVGLHRREAVRGAAAPVNYAQISLGEGMVGQTWWASAVDDKVDDSERKDGRRFASLLSVCPSVMIRNRSWTIRTNQCSCVEVTWLSRSQGIQKKYNKAYLPFFQRLTGSGGPGGRGISSNPKSLNVIAGKPRADFPVGLRVEPIVAGDLDIDWTERVSELGKIEVEEIS